VTRVARADKLMSIASEISDFEVDAESLAFMGQALVQTTLPHTDPGVSSFERTSGAVSLSIIADPKIGLPFGNRSLLLKKTPPTPCFCGIIRDHDDDTIATTRCA
jgi:hypothetical protein